MGGVDEVGWGIEKAFVKGFWGGGMNRVSR